MAAILPVLAETPEAVGDCSPPNIFAITMQHGDFAMSGLLCLPDSGDDNAVNGVILNDFGIRVLDFTVSQKGKVNITEAIGSLNKRPVKRALSSDLAFCLKCLSGNYPEERHRLAEPSDSILKVTNTLTHIIYTIAPIKAP